MLKEGHFVFTMCLKINWHSLNRRALPVATR